MTGRAAPLPQDNADHGRNTEDEMSGPATDPDEEEVADEPFDQ